ncbi:class I SAM-dependent methyltransferase [Phenylobacterium kunshanense]|uniref:Class I SAM-dependent methyltransferase n=1 Tax=Phenylobacterium kunshanense TaxID=1445034 RepID=A0A328BKI4_9CAUL|nr:class I SAM-dependent methyltransferase [Phenylobacterium kunshanense]RAK66506.1 class I SAM-dependent methyltransferase [Phenylobacterium kunshanense]
MSQLKRLYVAGVRAVRPVAASVGLLSALEKQGPGSRGARWARSLFAIYDIDQMTRLDLAWWTLDALDKVDGFLKQRPNARAFEYGSGASSVWLAKRVAELTSVEHDGSWADVVAAKLRDFPNATLKFRPADDTPHADRRYASEKPGWVGRTFHSYVHAIDETEGSFDLIVVDGRARGACLDVARNRLAPGGMIVFDNSRRPRYRAAIAASGLRAETTGGLTACLPYPDETTLLRHGGT